MRVPELKIPHRFRQYAVVFLGNRIRLFDSLSQAPSSSEFLAEPATRQRLHFVISLPEKAPSNLQSM